MNDANEPTPSNRVPPWRIGAGILVLAGLSIIAAFLAPMYVRNLQLERFLRETPAASDEIVKQTILDKGRSLGLDIAPDHLQVRHSPTDGQTSVRYVVRVSFPLYTVDLHFSSNLSAAHR